MRSALCLSLVLVACGGDSPSGPQPDAALPDADPIVDAPPDAPPSTCGSAGPSEMVCDGECVDTSSDPDHCGDCTTACSGETSACGAGTCVAPLTTTWVEHFGGDDFGHSVSAVAVDGAGNTYAAGFFEGTIDLGGGALASAGTTDIVIASFAPDGTHRWSKRFGAALGDQGAGLTFAAGKVYVTGTFTGTVDFGGGPRTSADPTTEDIVVLVLDATDGGYVADHTYGGTGSDAGLDVVVDADGNITFGGFFDTGTLDFGGGHTLTADAFVGFVASIDAAGVHRWSRRMGGNVQGNFSSVQSLAIDDAGNVAVACEFEGTGDFGAGDVTSAGNFDALVASYTPTGEARWVKRFGAGQSDTAASIAVDRDGDVLVGGGFHSSVDFGGSAPLVADGVVDGWFALLEGATGATRFARSTGSASSSAVRAVAFDPDDHALISANIDGETDVGTGPLARFGEDDILLAGLDPTTGATEFAKVYGGEDFEGLVSMAVTPGGSVALGGFFRGTVDLGVTVEGGARDNGLVMMIAR